jgi:hypothetical protein
MSESSPQTDARAKARSRGSGLFTDEGVARLAAAFSAATAKARKENERLGIGESSERVEEQGTQYGTGVEQAAKGKSKQ